MDIYGSYRFDFLAFVHSKLREYTKIQSRESKYVEVNLTSRADRPLASSKIICSDKVADFRQFGFGHEQTTFTCIST